MSLKNEKTKCASEKHYSKRKRYEKYWVDLNENIAISEMGNQNCFAATAEFH